MAELPLFTESGEGTEPLWQRKDMLVGLLHPGCPTCEAIASELRARRPKLWLQEVGTVVAPWGSAAGGKLSSALGIAPGEARLIVADRFLKPWRLIDAHREDALDESLAWMDYAQSRCGECSAPLDWGD